MPLPEPSNAGDGRIVLAMADQEQVRVFILSSDLSHNTTKRIRYGIL